ncbi:U-box domain-containing protein 4 [Hordeum vulgare]|nr:U-box domain-containing protein 4 [Hordeum vulgare]
MAMGRRKKRHGEQGQGSAANGKEVMPPSEMMPVQVPPTNDDVSEKPPSDKHRNYGHDYEESGPTDFCKVVMAPQLEDIPMPLDFTKHFMSVSREIKIGYMVTFKLSTPDKLKDIIFNDDDIELVTKCGRLDNVFDVNI